MFTFKVSHKYYTQKKRCKSGLQGEVNSKNKNMYIYVCSNASKRKVVFDEFIQS